jgi:hypothetical protein
MKGFFKGEGLERELRTSRPRPTDELVQKIEGRIRSERLASRRSFRVALPAAFTAIVIGGLAAVGGVSYAASSVVHAAKTVSHVFAPASTQRVVVLEGLSSGGDQYTPGYAWGDPAHNTDTAPAVTVGTSGSGTNAGGGAFAPPLTPKVVGQTATVKTSITLASQAHLFISVINTTKNKQLLITQKKSDASGKGLSGQQAKTVNYLVLVPRTIPLKLAVPSDYLHTGDSYVIQIIARAPNGKKTTVKIPFTS